MPKRLTADDFWDRLDKQQSGCWLWTMSTDRLGYGRVGFQGGKIRAHRLAWLLTHGTLPAGAFVLHRCDTPGCANPDHLFLGTHDENMRDMRSKQRGAIGSKNGQSRLSEADILEIVRLYRSGWLQVEIASRFGVTKSTISSICLGQKWRHLSIGNISEGRSGIHNGNSKRAQGEDAA